MFGEVNQQLWQSDRDELEHVAQGKSQLNFGVSMKSLRESSMKRYSLSAKVLIVKPGSPSVLSGGFVTF